ncbi:hypothetical protein HPP92_011884 [Vanilla planifolia]|uniref:Cytochrome P450 n=1 Tax=Vanilla planifolia TaxID=51239 RepID=A0A835V1I5_VANPL|nr:hypothetical protein HPP92_012216 [Vanilla planifolia]KAG0483800.1 hypothetical protein HPP92_011884 [Vanilla planifolia]
MELLLVMMRFLLSIFFLTHQEQQAASSPSNQQATPRPINLPVIANIHRLFGPNAAHCTNGQLSSTYCPMMLLKLGEISVVVISSSEAAADIMKTHELSFASRPISASTDAIFYGGNDIVFGCYDDFWRQMRGLCATHLLSSKRLRSYQAIRQNEISRLVRSIAAAPSGFFINLSEELFNLSNNITAFSVIGGRCKERRMFLSALGEASLARIRFKQNSIE